MAPNACRRVMAQRTQTQVMTPTHALRRPRCEQHGHTYIHGSVTWRKLNPNFRPKHPTQLYTVHALAVLNRFPQPHAKGYAWHKSNETNTTKKRLTSQQHKWTLTYIACCSSSVYQQCHSWFCKWLHVYKKDQYQICTVLTTLSHAVANRLPQAPHSYGRSYNRKNTIEQCVFCL